MNNDEQTTNLVESKQTKVNLTRVAHFVHIISVGFLAIIFVLAVPSMIVMNNTDRPDTMFQTVWFGVYKVILVTWVLPCVGSVFVEALHIFKKGKPSLDALKCF